MLGEVYVGFSFARRSTVDQVTVDSTYDGTAYRGGLRSDADPWALHGGLLLGPRFPVGAFAFAAGPGIGFDLWSASPSEGAQHYSNDSIKSAERISQGMLTIPLFAQVTWKPTCGLAMTLTGLETIGVTGPKTTYPGMALGVVWESCTGRDMNAAVPAGGAAEASASR
jgi:hypothetical protein